ncbi:MAG TPA: type II secretion system F family protein [Pseudolabrys sp.]|nr:type II secretion system F family protein [Pseudolabrys sp.]
MPKFQYRALTQNGEIVSGSIVAVTAADVSAQIEYLGFVPIETFAERERNFIRMAAAFLGRPRPEDVTIFTRDLSLLLRAGARLHAALDLLANDIEVGRLRPIVEKIKSAVMSGESFAEAIAHHGELFSPMYVALVRVGESSGALDNILDLLAAERTRADALRRKLIDALQYPTFVLAAACGVLGFFLLFVLPQFSAVLRDLNAKLDPQVGVFLDFSDVLHAHMAAVGIGATLILIGAWLALRQSPVRAAIIARASQLPFVRTAFGFYRSGLFCRNLAILLSSGVNLTATLRILVDIMSTVSSNAIWTVTADRVRHGGKLSDALATTSMLPPMAVRMLRLGEETGQLAQLSSRVADFYEAKLQRSLDRIVGVAGPAAIIAISVVVGGLIVSVMTALLSVSQIVG